MSNKLDRLRRYIHHARQHQAPRDNLRLRIRGFGKQQFSL